MLLTATLLLALAALVEAAAYDDRDPAVAILVNLAAVLPLAVWSRWTALPVAAVVTAATFMLVCGVETLTAAAVVGTATALYLLARQWPWGVWVLFVLPFAINAVIPVDRDLGRPIGVAVLVVVVAAALLGDAQRANARVIAERDASRAAMERTLHDRVAMEERARIAREMHDVVAHNLSVIAVQAETARLTTPGLDDEGRRGFAAIGDTAREALGEMRRLLGVLRPGVADQVEHTPQPGLAELDELVDTTRSAGTAVRLTVSGPTTPLPAGIDLVAYRIVQEALTNARRHAPGAAVEVDVRYEPTAVRLRIANDDPNHVAGDEPTGGHGLLGMRERVALAGGTLRAGHGDAGEFVVEAVLSLPEPAT